MIFKSQKLQSRGLALPCPQPAGDTVCGRDPSARTPPHGWGTQPGAVPRVPRLAFSVSHSEGIKCPAGSRCSDRLRAGRGAGLTRWRREAGPGDQSRLDEGRPARVAPSALGQTAGDPSDSGSTLWGKGRSPTAGGGATVHAQPGAPPRGPSGPRCPESSPCQPRPPAKPLNVRDKSGWLSAHTAREPGPACRTSTRDTSPPAGKATRHTSAHGARQGPWCDRDGTGGVPLHRRGLGPRPTEAAAPGGRSAGRVGPQTEGEGDARACSTDPGGGRPTQLPATPRGARASAAAGSIRSLQPRRRKGPREDGRRGAAGPGCLSQEPGLTQEAERGRAGPRGPAASGEPGAPGTWLRRPVTPTLPRAEAAGPALAPATCARAPCEVAREGTSARRVRARALYLTASMSAKSGRANALVRKMFSAKRNPHDPRPSPATKRQSRRFPG